ncbi:a408758f-014d-4926-b3f5-2a0681b78f8f [Sclerotinia trifoliorum]|uniref:A408758f-014d-4926-b3f5-2a0681b78f8f n=1 Tax=Sclerotinia trifoliorum TaxID=28548 RepID=A0A8H2W3P9_9HELO|nr:a408758f-014d-4926-b3f5-2a0681b78f8f [Sclerotinia trifoliorum]
MRVSFTLRSIQMRPSLSVQVVPPASRAPVIPGNAQAIWPSLQNNQEIIQTAVPNQGGIGEWYYIGLEFCCTQAVRNLVYPGDRITTQYELTNADKQATPAGQGPFNKALFAIEPQRGSTWDFGPVQWDQIGIKADTTRSDWCSSTISTLPLFLSLALKSIASTALLSLEIGHHPQHHRPPKQPLTSSLVLHPSWYFYPYHSFQGHSQCLPLGITTYHHLLKSFYVTITFTTVDGDNVLMTVRTNNCNSVSSAFTATKHGNNMGNVTGNVTSANGGDNDDRAPTQMFPLTIAWMAAMLVVICVLEIGAGI